MTTSVYVLVAVVWALMAQRLAWGGLDALHWGHGVAILAMTGLLIGGATYRRSGALARTRHAHRAMAKDLRAIFSASPTAVYALDPAGNVTAWNLAAKRLFGYSSGEVLGGPDPTVPPEERPHLHQTLMRVMSEQVITRVAAKRRRKNGQCIETSFSLAPLRNEDGRVVGALSIVADPVEQWQTARLRQEREDYRESSRAMHEVLGVIGHELRTPLAGLRALAEFVLSEPDRNTQQVEQFLTSINDEVSRCGEMVNNMLEAARLESGLAKWSWRRVSLERVCHEALEIVRPLARSKQIAFPCCIAPETCAIMGDADAVRRLILNLLTNAVKHTVEGEIAIEAREATGPDHRWVQICVRDTGRGISPEIAQNLGRAFAANGGSVGSQYLKGAGLGLAICREIVNVHGGRISVTSSRGRGTKITILLRADLESPVTGERIEEPIPLVNAA